MSRKRHNNKVIKSSIPLVDICILTAGRFDILRKCLEAAEREAKSIPSKILLRDNASNRQSKIQNMDIFEHENVQYYRSEVNTGYPNGYNELIRRGNSPLVLVLTDDVILQPGALDALVRRMDDPTIGMCGTKNLFPEDCREPKLAGKIQHVGMSCDMNGMPFHIFLGWDADHPKTMEAKQVFAVTGACFIIRRSLFNKVGGFFEGYGLGTFEDIDLSLAVREAGYKVFIEPAALATHYTGATAEMLQTGFPLQMNHMIFRSRNAHRMFWSEPFDW
jgi:O-antigen biosynthesis protein